MYEIECMSGEALMTIFIKSSSVDAGKLAYNKRRRLLLTHLQVYKASRIEGSLKSICSTLDDIPIDN